MAPTKSKNTRDSPKKKILRGVLVDLTKWTPKLSTQQVTGKKNR